MQGDLAAAPSELWGTRRNREEKETRRLSAAIIYLLPDALYLTNLNGFAPDDIFLIPCASMAETENSKAKDANQPQGGLSRWTPSLPTTNIIGMLNPFSGNEKTTSHQEDNMGASQTNKRTSIFSSILPNGILPTTSPTPESPSKDGDSDMFAEPETRTNSDDGSREGSIDDSERRKSRKLNKPKTCFSLCHPPPASTTRQRLHRRPRSLMQLHKLSPNARPKPAFEVIPSANFSVKLTKAITKVFKAKHGLCPNDLVVLRAEKYSTEEQDEEQEARDIIALICKGRKEDGQAAAKAKICLPDGQEWEAYPTLNGGYEFFSTDEHGLGLTVRWVPKKNKDGSKPNPDRKRFNFSTISPNSRRHPVIATLSKTELDVNDTYKMPDPSAVTPLSTPKQATTPLADVEEEETEGNQQCETDDRLREIIVMTSIWVTFKEGWSPTFKYEEKDSNGFQRSPSLPVSPSKASTFSGASMVTTPPGSPTPQLEKRSSIKSVGSGILRRSSMLSKGNRKSTISVPEDESETASQFDAPKKTGRARADSASTVLVHRAASNRVKNHHQATWRPELLLELQEPPSAEKLKGPPSDPGSSTPERAEDVAQPILPPTTGVEREECETPANSKSIPKPIRQSSSQKEKRGSSATTTTRTSGTSEASRKPAKAAQPVKKKSAWRRLLCGGGEQDI